MITTYPHKDGKEAEHIHPVELRDELFQKAPAEAEALKKIVQSVKNHVSVIMRAIGEIHALTPPTWCPSTGSGSNRFVGRLPDTYSLHLDDRTCHTPGNDRNSGEILNKI
jgi:hypothetical protein